MIRKQMVYLYIRMAKGNRSPNAPTKTDARRFLCDKRPGVDGCTCTSNDINVFKVLEHLIT